MLRCKHVKLPCITLFKALPFLNYIKWKLQISLQYACHDIGYIDYFTKKCLIKKYEIYILGSRAADVKIYAQFRLLCPQAQENTNVACTGKAADTLAVLLPLTAERERALTGQPSLIKHGTHVDGVNSLVKLLS